MYLPPEKYDPSKSEEIAKEIGYFNEKIGKDNPYILSGPGRWGSADPWLGVPITWQQISNTKIIIELGHEDFPVDPSFGSHFFQNITSLHIGYLTIDHKNINDSLNFNWLTTLKPKEEKNILNGFNSMTLLKQLLMALVVWEKF